MRAIINGFRYDSERAELIGEAQANYPRNDFGFWEAGLYRTPRSGNYFIAGKGGSMTRWARRSPDGSTIGGEGIIPLTPRDALEWAEQNLEPEEIEAEVGFSLMIEDA